MPVDTLSTRGYSDTESYNHRFNARLEWKISDNQNLMVRPSCSYQSNDPLTHDAGLAVRRKRLQPHREPQRRPAPRLQRADERRLPRQTGQGRPYDHRRRRRELLGQYQRLELLLETCCRSRISGPTASTRPSGDGTRRATRALRYLRNLAPSSSYRLRGQFTYTEPVAKYAQVGASVAATW